MCCSEESIMFCFNNITRIARDEYNIIIYYVACSFRKKRNKRAKNYNQIMYTYKIINRILLLLYIFIFFNLKRIIFQCNCYIYALENRLVYKILYNARSYK